MIDRDDDTPPTPIRRATGAHGAADPAIPAILSAVQQQGLALGRLEQLAREQVVASAQLAAAIERNTERLEIVAGMLTETRDRGRQLQVDVRDLQTATLGWAHEQRQLGELLRHHALACAAAHEAMAAQLPDGH